MAISLLSSYLKEISPFVFFNIENSDQLWHTTG